jgi:hypothetical protein
LLVQLFAEFVREKLFTYLVPYVEVTELEGSHSELEAIAELLLT